jgi:phosphohistidine phosphatase
MESRRLVLIRHSKAADGPVDTERPLADQGRDDAPAIGRWLASADLAPDRVVVSPATRARQTWGLAASQIADAPSPTVDARMYDNTVESLREIVRETPADVGVLVLVGHNPSVEEFAHYLDDGRGESEARRQMAQKYPTSGVAVIELTTAWADVQADAGTLTAFGTPRGG